MVLEETMKRRLQSEQSLLSMNNMKRAKSSMFSIATIIDDTDIRENNPVGELKARSDSVASEISMPDVSESSSKTQTTAMPENSSLSDAGSSSRSVAFVSNSEIEEGDSSSDGFYIDDGDDDDIIPTRGQSFIPHCFSKSKTVQHSVKEQEKESSFVVTASKPRKESDCLRTGVVFEASELHFDRHSRFHKERPLRVTSIRNHLNEAKDIKHKCTLFGEFEDDSTIGKVENVNGEMVSPEKTFLDDDDYLRVHVPGYIQRLDRLSNCTCCDKLDREAEQYKSIYFTKDSVNEAKTAAAKLCRLVSDVMTDKLDNGFAVIRPPGHHAEPGIAGGYCVINNVAVAAAYAKEKLGAKKVLIVDWDVHHGNGTQAIFLNDPNVLYFSAHRYHGGNFFPYLQNGGPSAVGVGEGAGFNINVGWNQKGMGDLEYLAVWEKVLMPVAREFQPDLVLVSAGFDAADGDMGECHITPECFSDLTKQLMTLADGKIVCALEGGYVRSVLAKCVESVIRTLLDREQADSEEITQTSGEKDILDCINSSAAKSIRTTIGFHQVYWNSLKEPPKTRKVSFDSFEVKKDC